MAAIFFCKHYLVRQRLYAGAGLSLPALSFAALVTGFTFSLNLPSSLHTIMPVVESMFLVSLPHLWQGFLAWITPPCLFVLLNGIIMILTATSGRSSSCCRNGFSVTESISDNLPNLPYNQNAAGLKQTLIATPLVETAPLLEDALQIIGPSLELQLLDAAEDDLQEEPFDEAIDDDKELDFVIITKEESMQSVKKEQNVNVLCRSSSTSSFPSLCRSSPPSSSSLSSCHQAPALLVDDDIEVCEEAVKVESALSISSQCHSPASLVKTNMRRSISIDSASFVSNRDEPSDDQLSAEAFKKRIEDFIRKTTSKMSDETGLAV